MKLTGANKVPLNTRKEMHKRSVFDSVQFQRPSVFDRLERAKNTVNTGNSNFESHKAMMDNGPAQRVRGPTKPIFFCNQCLRQGHLKQNCRNRLRCRECSKEGHLARFCQFGKQKLVYVPKNKFIASFGKTWANPSVSGWFKMKAKVSSGPSSSGPTKFSSFTEFHQFLERDDELSPATTPPKKETGTRSVSIILIDLPLTSPCNSALASPPTLFWRKKVLLQHHTSQPYW